MLTAYIDDSGFDGESPCYLLAGYVGTPEAWANFAKEWSAALGSSTPGPLAYYKAKEAARLQGQFKAWRPEDRDSKQRELVAITNRHAEFGAASKLSRSIYDHEIRPLAEQMLPPERSLMNSGFSPYMHLLSDLVFMLLERACKRREMIDFVLDSQEGREELAAQFYATEVHRFFDRMLPASFKQFIGTLTFAKDNEALPLQAADMLAWHENRHTARQFMEGTRPLYADIQAIHIKTSVITARRLREQTTAMTLGFDPYDKPGPSMRLKS